MKIEIKVIGNRSLYSSLYKAYDVESTKHRTYTGAARRLMSLHHKAKGWAVATGQWGTVRVVIDGEDIDGEHNHAETWWTVDHIMADRSYHSDPVADIAKHLKESHEYMVEESA